jgi:hypothetical protein
MIRNKSRGHTITNATPNEFENKMQFINFNTGFKSSQGKCSNNFTNEDDYKQQNDEVIRKAMHKRNGKHMMQYTNMSKETSMATEEDTLMENYNST